MDYKHSVACKDTYVEARSDGEKSLQTAMILWEEIVRVCNEHNCFKILGIANSSRGMPVMDSVKHRQLLQDFSITRQYKIAWVELNPEELESVKFLENFLLNRCSVRGKLFRDIEEAKSWLLGI